MALVMHWKNIYFYFNKTNFKCCKFISKCLNQCIVFAKTRKIFDSTSLSRQGVKLWSKTIKWCYECSCVWVFVMVESENQHRNKNKNSINTGWKVWILGWRCLSEKRDHKSCLCSPVVNNVKFNNRLFLCECALNRPETGCKSLVKCRWQKAMLLFTHD